MNDNIGTKIGLNVERALKALQEVEKEVKKIPPALDETGESAKKAGDNFSNSFQKAKSITKDLENTLKNSAIFGWIGGLKSAIGTLTKVSSKQAEYIEDLNFLDQAYNNSADSGLKLLDTLEKTIGFDPAGLTRPLASFRQLGNALAIDDDIANRLAENLVKLSVDTKSITGQSLDTVTNKYMSAMAGNTRVVRTYGIDITQAGLQQEAFALGIEKSVSEMTRAEKSILTYITMARQMSSANGDMSRTINSTANMYEIFKNQISETGRLMGGFLIPILKAVLPLINGVMMAINVLLNSLLSLFGIDAGSLSQEFGTFSSGLEDIADDFDNIGISATKAGKAAKAAQLSLRGFDKLNVIKTPTPSSGSGVSGGVGGGIGGLGAIDSSLLEKLGEYDLHLDSINNKAAEIRDSIMEWLGFTKIIDPITGDISWQYEGLGKTITNIAKSIWDLPTPLKIIAGLGIASKLGLLTKLLPKIKNMLGAVITPTLGLIRSIGNYGLVGGFKGWSDNAKDMEKFGAAVGGVSIAILGNRGLVESMKNAISEGGNLENTVIGLGGILTSAAGGALTLGAYFGPLGAAIGGVAGGLLSIVEAFIELGERRDIWEEFLETSGEKLNKFTTSLKEQYDQVEKIANQDMTKAVASERLIAELDKITDANGKVKKGYEDRANFILNELNQAYGTEIKMVDGVIEKYDEQIGSIKKQIELNKAKIYQQYAEENYAIAIKNQVEAENLLNEALAMEKSIREDPTLDETTRAEKLRKVNKQLEEARSNIAKNQKAVAQYEGISTAIINGNIEDIEKWEKAIATNMSEAESNVFDYYGSAAQVSANYYEQNLKETGKNFSELNEQQKEFVTRQLTMFTDMFQNGVKEAGEITPEMVAAWRNMSDQSEDAFIVALGQLPQDLRQQVVDKMYPEGQGISEKLQAGINSLGVTVKPKIEQPSSSSVSTWVSKLATSLNAKLGISFKFNAEGGLYSSGIWRPMKTYANGGFPSYGELFVAREKGPELVGKIGNSTAVMNNDQILDQMTIAVARGMAASGNKEKPVQIIAEGDTEGFMNFITFKQISQNRQFGL